MPQVNAQTLLTHGVTFEADRLPDRCPQCHAHVQPKHLLSIAKDPLANHGRIMLTFQCPRQACQEVFLAYYRFIYAPDGKYEEWRFDKSAPQAALPTEFSREVQAVSANFVNVYNQAIAAETAGLDQLTGIGLRKALEFLVKDFLVKQEPEKKEEIEKTLLGPCIDRFISDPNLKDCAKRAAWLGNDETHYVRRWSDRDVNDLKVLTRLTVMWIESVLLTAKYREEMK